MRRILHDLKPSYEHSKSYVEFSLPSSQHDLPCIYQTGDQIKGDIFFKPCRDIILRNVCITFEGTTPRDVDAINIVANVLGICIGITKATIWEPNIETRTGCPCTTQRFMRLNQPVDEPLLSEGMVLEPGRTYRLPFLFVVPSGLLPQACQHPCEHTEIKCHHLNLPPSLGLGFYPNPKGKNRFSSSLEPDTASIAYAIRFTAIEVKRETNLPITSVDRAHKIHVLPKLPEMPPILIPGDNTTYQLSKVIAVKQLNREKLGRLTATASQPKAIQLGQIHSRPMQPTPTMLAINFEFLSVNHNRSPPKPKKIQSKLNAVTHFGIEPYEDLPDRIQQRYLYPRHRSFCRNITLSSPDIISVHWVKQCSEMDGTASGENKNVVYTASISLPIVLPENVVYTPTFFSCLVSRTYSLRVDAFFNKVPFMSKVSLTIPIQICSDIASEQN